MSRTIKGLALKERFSPSKKKWVFSLNIFFFALRASLVVEGFFFMTDLSEREKGTESEKLTCAKMKSKAVVVVSRLRCRVNLHSHDIENFQLTAHTKLFFSFRAREWNISFSNNTVFFFGFPSAPCTRSTLLPVLRHIADSTWKERRLWLWKTVRKFSSMIWRRKPTRISMDALGWLGKTSANLGQSKSGKLHKFTSSRNSIASMKLPFNPYRHSYNLSWESSGWAEWWERDCLKFLSLILRNRVLFRSLARSHSRRLRRSKCLNVLSCWRWWASKPTHLPSWT